MPIEAQVRLDPFAQGWSGRSTPFFLSHLLIIYLLFPYLVLTLVLSSNIFQAENIFKTYNIEIL